MSDASPQDYVRDPTRSGSPEVAALFPGFKHMDMRRRAPSFACVMELRAAFALAFLAIPTIMCFGHAVAVKLAQRYHVVCPDLHGYCDSWLPDPGARLIN